VPLGDRHGETGRKQRPLTRLDVDVDGAAEVEASVARVRALGEARTRVEPLERQLGHEQPLVLPQLGQT
jgi:hypothetical protein